MNYDVFISYSSSDAQIANAVCHYLEEKKLRCFIAPRDIVPPDWAGSIERAIEHSTAFVIILSENSMMSNEVAKEVTLATRMSDFIFPFRIDETQLNGRMNYHLSAYHWIDAVTPPIEKRIAELAERVERSLRAGQGESEYEIAPAPSKGASLNTRIQRILSQTVSPRAEFLGREAELNEIDALYDRGVNAVFLCGMGGIGKSEIAKAYAQQHRERFPTVIFAVCETDLCSLIASDSAVPVENLSQSAASGGAGETTEEYFERKMAVLKSIMDERTLFIIDNFDQKEDGHLEEILALPCKLLLTSRADFSDYGYEMVRIEPMRDLADLVQLAEKLYRPYPAGEEKKALEEIILLLGKHTYAVSLAASQMKADHMKPSKMLAKLQNEGMHIQTRGTFSRKPGEKAGTAYDHIRALFDFSGLDEEACQVLRCLACMPKEGIDTDLFLEYAGIEEYGIVAHLAELNWVQRDDEKDRLGLHMLVRELVWDELKPTQENCRILLDHIYENTKNAWNAPYELNDSIRAMVYSVTESFPSVHVEFLDHFEAMATFAWIMGNFTLSEKCELTLYQLCCDTWGGISVPAGRQALRVAAVYHNQADYAAARPWYQKALDILNEADEGCLDAWLAAGKVARCYAQQGDFARAGEIYRHNLAVFDRYLDDSTPETIRRHRVEEASVKQNVAHICAIEGKYDEALALCDEAYDYFITDTVESSLVSYTLTNRARILYGAGRYEQAISTCEEAMEITAHYRSDEYLDYLHLEEMKGDNLIKLGRYQEAMDVYAHALGTRELRYPSDTVAIRRLERKCDCAQNEVDGNFPPMELWS